MYKIIKSIRGMHDYLPEELKLWNYIENIIKEVLNSYCYLEIRLPILEKTEIFQRAIGNVTDIIEKEMYSFEDRKGSNITLRPEGTIGCVRAIIQNNLLYKKKQKFWYFGPMFRYERPQKGRYRQFYQFGAEVFGIDGEDIDLEIILLTYRIWKRLGLENNIILEINSIGSQLDRIKYKKKLIFFLKKYEYLLDEDCKRRLYTNPLRILDSKNKDVQEILTKAPLLNEYLDTASQNHFQSLCKMMDIHGIPYRHNKYLVRGLDYYSSTVFEWKNFELGSQNTICAGGRYDSLFEELNTNKISGIGFAIGMERLVLLMQKLNIFFPTVREVDIYIIIIGNHNTFHATALSEEIRNLYPKLKIFIDFSDDNISKKIKHAANILAPIAIFIGDNEIKKKCFLVKDLVHKKQYYILKSDILIKINHFFKIIK
ncbi:histidine--tRNA ligase [Buchnera aphidicola]|uniref:histidine--tRNA ligase n=1 Tax=Buchnera aphidicola TaxID=9 RepID=UPI003BEEE681